MKIQGTTVETIKDKNGNDVNAKTNYVNVNFGRAMLVQLQYGDNGVAIEYSPYGNHTTKIAKMEAVIQLRPNVKTKNSAPGFIAKVTVYNPGEDLFQFVKANARFPTSKIGQDRPSVKISAGYWNPETQTEHYDLLFSGLLNSSSYYRKGTDTVMELYCHNISMTVNDFATQTRTLRMTEEEQRIRALQDNVVELKKGMNYLVAIKKTIQSLEVTRSPRDVVNYFGVNIPRTKQPGTSLPSSKVNDMPKERKEGYTEWINVQTTLGPVNYLTQNVQLDRNLMEIFLETPIPQTFKFSTAQPSDNELDKQLGRLLNTLGFGVDSFHDIHDDISPQDGLDHWYFWMTNTSKKTKNNIMATTGKTVVLEDFQNFIDPPVFNGNAQMVLKMMFNPDILPNDNIMLVWDAYNTNTILNKDDKVQGGQLSASLANYYPQLQAGRYALVAKQLANKATGDIFNTPIGVMLVQHELQTMGNKWYTTVTTYGFKYKNEADYANKTR